jgi:hypothetical protein
LLCLVYRRCRRDTPDGSSLRGAAKFGSGSVPPSVLRRRRRDSKQTYLYSTVAECLSCGRSRDDQVPDNPLLQRFAELLELVMFVTAVSSRQVEIERRQKSEVAIRNQAAR